MITKINFITIITIIMLILSLTLIIFNTITNKDIQNKKIEEYNKRIQYLQYESDSLRLELLNYKNIENKIRKLNNNISRDSLKNITTAINYYSEKFNLKPELLISIAYIESNFKKYAVSHVGCLGYFQINPNVHNINKDLIFDEFYNTKWACLILNNNLNRYNKNYKLALNAYNGWVSDKNNYADKVINVYKKIIL